MPVGLIHDARYDLDDGITPYSRTLLGIEPIPVLDLEAGYHSGRDESGVLLYDAVSLGARFSFSEKWQINGFQTVSATRDRLSTRVGVSRFGHDYVFEIEYTFRAGEGGSSIGFNFTPLLMYREPALGLLGRWTQEY
jgi:hypothetical protein